MLTGTLLDRLPNRTQPSVIPAPNPLGSRPRISSRWWPYRSPRDEPVSTPSGPEGSSGRSGFGCRGAADTPPPPDPLERCPSGRRSTPGKCVWVNRPSRVRIPPSPPLMQYKLLLRAAVEPLDLLAPRESVGRGNAGAGTGSCQAVADEPKWGLGVSQRLQRCFGAARPARSAAPSPEARTPGSGNRTATAASGSRT